MALDVLRSSVQRIHLVLLDIVMPVMDGVELLNIIKARVDLLCRRCTVCAAHQLWIVAKIVRDHA